MNNQIKNGLSNVITQEMRNIHSHPTLIKALKQGKGMWKIYKTITLFSNIIVKGKGLQN